MINVTEDQNFPHGSLMRTGSLQIEYRFFFEQLLQAQVQLRKSNMHNRLILPLGWRQSRCLVVAAVLAPAGKK